MIGLSGCHRTGKTTLCEYMAGEEYSLPFVRTNASEIFKELGYDPKKDYDIQTRLKIQRAILKRFTESYDMYRGRLFVTDRTPLDLAAYTLADVTRENITYEEGIEVRNYVSDCLAELNKYFSLVVVLPPFAFEVGDEEGKAPVNPAYMLHIHSIIMGVVCDPDQVSCNPMLMRQDLVSSEDRAAGIMQWWTQYIKAAQWQTRDMSIN